MRRKKPVVISDLLTIFIREHKLEEGFRQYRFMKLWDETVGPAVTRATIDKQLVGTKLYIRLSSSVVRSELYMSRSQLVSELNRQMGETIIDEIILK